MLFHKIDRRNCKRLLFFVNNAIVIENDWVGGRRILHIESSALCFVSNSKRFGTAVDRILLQGSDKAPLKNQYTFPDPGSY